MGGEPNAPLRRAMHDVNRLGNKILILERVTAWAWCICCLHHPSLRRRFSGQIICLEHLQEYLQVSSSGCTSEHLRDEFSASSRVPTESGSLQVLLHLQDQKQKQNYSALLQNYSALLLLQRLLVLLLILLIQVLLLTQVLLLSLTFFNRSSYKT